MKHLFITISFIATTITNIFAADYDFSAVCETGQTLYYKIFGINAVMVTYPQYNYGGSFYSGFEPTGNLIIPETVTNGGITYTVTKIGGSAFYICGGLTTITVPNTVTVLGVYPLGGCRNLQSITLPFAGNTAESTDWCLGYLFGSYDNDYYLTTYRQYHNGGIYVSSTSYAIPKTLKSVTITGGSCIPDEAFSGCSSLETITISESVTTIGNYAFLNCGITSFEIPSSVTNIGDYAFSGCSNLSIFIPKTVTTIGQKAFGIRNGATIYCEAANRPDGWSNLWNHIEVSDFNTNIIWDAHRVGDYYFQITNQSTHTAMLCEYLGNDEIIEIPETVVIDGVEYEVTAIRENAYKENYNHTAVTITTNIDCSSAGLYFTKDGFKYQVLNKNNVAIISAPETCTGDLVINSVTAGNSFNIVDAWSGAFGSCAPFSSITIEHEMDCSNAALFFIKDGIKYRVLSKNTVAIAMVPTTYTGAMVINTVTAGNTFTITGIDNNAFENCSGLTSITIPNSVTNIGSSAFSGCSGLLSILLPNGITSIESNTFKDCSSLTSLTIPNTVTDIADGAFNGCSSLETMTLPIVKELGAMFGKSSYTGGVVTINYGGFATYYVPQSLKEVNITGSTTIPIGAFAKCIGLTSITIPETVTNINYSAFYNCTGLTSVIIPNSVTSISYAFRGCSGLLSVTIPNSVTSIDREAFNNSNTIFICEAPNKPNGWNVQWNNNQGTVYWGVSFIKDGIAYKIGENNTVAAVKYIGTAERVEIPSTVEHNGVEYAVTSIGANAFSGCNSLQSVSIPNSVATIGENAFSSSINLTSVSIPTTITSLSNGMFRGCSSLQSVNIPQSVTTIENDAFYNCSSLESIAIPNSVTSIGNNSFYGCSGVETVSIPQSVGSIGSNAFAGCGNVKSLTFNTNAIGTHFQGKQQLAEINIGSAVTAIADNAFNGCTSLESVSVPNTVETIGNSAFNGCSSLTSVSLPSSITTINEYAFAGCSNLQSISIPRSVTGIGRYAFSGTGLTSFSVPNQVATIGTYAFQNCNHLKTVSIPSSVESIGANAFSGCDSITTLSFNTNAIDLLFAGKRLLSTINIGEEVTAIPNSAFASTNLTTVALPDNVTTIGSYAFENCKHLKTVSIPSSVESIGGGAFSGCDSIKSLTFNTNAIGDLFSGKKELMVVNIGEAVTSLNANAFSGCTSLPIIIIPDGVENVGASAFANCSSLTIYITKAKVPTDWNAQWNPDPRPVVVSAKVSGDFIYQVTNISSRELSIVRYLGNSPSVSIPEAPVISGNTFSVKAVGNSAFAGIDALRQIVVPNSVTSIGDYAFSDCANLETVIMGNTLASIGSNAFNECRKVSSIKIGNATPPTVGESAFEAIDKWETVIYVPCNSLQAYPAAASWNEFVQYIGSQSFILAVDSENERKGTAKITQQPDCANSTAVIEATAKAGYTFLSWSDGNTVNPRTLTVSGNLALTALFAVDVNVAITSSDTERGHVENITPIYEYDYNAPITVQAVAHHGYSFAGWDDGSNENPRTITLNQEVAIQALFSINQYHLALSVNNAVRGSIVDNSGDFDFKTQITTSATANYGYKFVGWNDGVLASQRTILLWNDTTIQAVFEPEKYEVTLKGNVEGRGTFTGGGEHNYLTTCQITATPLYGYEFTGWSDGVNDNPRTITVTKPMEFMAVFVPKVYELSVTSANEELGTVASSNSFDYKTVTNISATAATHYHFVQWNDGNRQNPRQVTVERDTLFVATFGIDTFSVAAKCDTAMGAVSGAGLYSYGSAAKVEAKPAAHHHFVRWTNGTEQTAQEFVVEHDTAFEAVFAIDRHSVALAVSDSLCGAVSGAGSYDYGASVQLQATPAANCYFTGWSDGVTTNPRTLTVEGDTTIVAEFGKLQTVNIMVAANDSLRGTVAGTGSYVVGSNATLSATASAHYLFEQWSDGRTDNPRTVRVIADATYTAVFVPMQYNIILSQNNADMGMVSGSGVYSYGERVSCLAKPYPNYHFVQWSNGGTANPYEFVVEEDKMLTAYFAAGAVTALGDEDANAVHVYANGRAIIIENADAEIFLYDAMGRLIGRDAINRVRTEIRVNAAGVYIVKTGNVVMRVVVE